MHVITRKRLKEFAERYHDAVEPLTAWFKLMRGCHAQNFAELRTFGGVDHVSIDGAGLHIFDIGGNKYRLIAALHCNSQKVFIRNVLTHQEYDAVKWK